MNMLDSGNVSDHPYQKQFETFFQTIDQKKICHLPAWTMLYMHTKFYFRLTDQLNKICNASLKAKTPFV